MFSPTRYILILLLSFIFLGVATPSSGQTSVDYWEEKQRMGTNSFNDIPPSQDYFDAFAAYGGEWVRLTWTKWESGGDGEFLIGDPSNYKGLVQKDVETLKKVVKRARKSGLKVVLVPLSLPGSVFTQHNNDEIDDRIYSDRRYWEQSAQFWADVALIFKDDPTVVAYNLLNEPTPERAAGYERASPEENKAWYEQNKNSARDLPEFYDYIIIAIRKVDSNKPIMLDGGFYAAPQGFDYFSQNLEHDHILYSFHMYQPWLATSAWNVRNGSKLTYPGEMTIWGKTESWTAERISQTIKQPLIWADERGIDRKHIVLGEFGCHRYLKWCPVYLEDVLSVADEEGLHWAFYTFRSDSWGGMDYELGHDRPGQRRGGVTSQEFWRLSEQKQLNRLPRTANPAFEPILKRLAKNLTEQ